MSVTQFDNDISTGVNITDFEQERLHFPLSRILTKCLAFL